MEGKVVNSEERVWAALAHGSALLFFFGPILPVVVWFTQRKKSAYAAFHALQAMVYQILFFWLWVAVVPILMFCFLIVAIPISASSFEHSNNPEVLGMLFPFATWGILFAVFGLYVLIGIIGAIFSLTGREFRYPLFGSQLARFLGYSAATESMLDEDKEDRLVAAVGHSTAILLLWGIVVPLIVWITQKERSGRLKFQALQATIYQGLGMLAYFVFMAVYMFFIFGTMAVFMLSSSSNNSQLNPIVGLLFFVPFLLFMFVFLILGPLYQLFAFIASIKVLRGKDYKYPILGNIIFRRMGLDRQVQPEASK